MKSMKHSLKWLHLVVVVCLILLMAASLSMAAGVLEINWWTVDGGGHVATGSTFVLSGTVGQPDAGYTLTGGDFAVAGGFWDGLESGEYTVYLPTIIK